MTHTGTQTIETERLILRRYRAEDAQAMFDNWAGDDAVTKFMTWPTYRKAQEAADYIAYVCGRYEEEAYYDWVIEIKEIGQPIGSISAVDFNEELGIVHIGYCIGRPWWRRGITSEAFAAVIRYFFETVGVHRVEARHDVNNPHSGGVMRKCGLTYEGTLRQSGRNNQGICDMAWYGMLREEYFAGKE